MYIVYILLCADDSLYTGITKNLERRFTRHVLGKASRYTRSHRPLKVVYTEVRLNKSLALKREGHIKRLTREEKLSLIAKTKK